MMSWSYFSILFFFCIVEVTSTSSVEKTSFCSNVKISFEKSQLTGTLIFVYYKKPALKSEITFYVALDFPKLKS